MAVMHRARIVPTKLELLQAWVPQQPWLGGADASTLSVLGAYRFDDPEGEVGIETFLLAAADGQVLQVPLTYRGAALAGACDALITTMTHTALGDRWVYDGVHDPAYRAALATTILTGGRQADEFVATDAGLEPRTVTTQVRGSGSTPRADVPDWRTAQVVHDATTTLLRAERTITLLRMPTAAAASLALTGTWPGRGTPALLATTGGVS